jgi:adenylate cyclase
MFDNRENKLLRKALALYASEHVVSRVLAEGEKFLAPHAATVEATMLFFDVASFKVDEPVTGESLLRWQSTYAEAMTRTIASAGGTFDIFVGESGSAWWSAEDGPDHPSKAVDCAQALLGAVAALNKNAKTAGAPDIRLRVGIHTGRVALGNHGSPTKLRYTVMGDAVNIAARLCGPQFGRPIVMSDFTRALLRDKTKTVELGDIPIKDSLPLKVFGIGGEEHAI